MRAQIHPPCFTHAQPGHVDHADDDDDDAEDEDDEGEEDYDVDDDNHDFHILMKVQMMVGETLLMACPAGRLAR